MPLLSLERVQLGRRHRGVGRRQHLAVVRLKVKVALVLVGKAVLGAEQALAAALKACGGEGRKGEGGQRGEGDE